MKRAWAIAAGLVVGLLPGMPAGAYEAPAPRSLPLVQTQSGPVQGGWSADGLARVWLGIPYAAAPVGERRWQATQPHPPWNEVLKADAYGSPCAQLGSIYGPPPAGQPWGPANIEAFGKPVGSEDCLTLNIWRPDSEARGLPVLVFIHGGAGVAGYSGDPVYDGARLAVGAKAVVITLNYRLGIFGGFLHPALQGADALGNSGAFAMLDMLQALRFVQANAAAFGGDPGNVTLAGQSAGAIAVFTLMGSKLAQGLFHKAIAMSGLIGSGSNDRARSYAHAERIGALIAVDQKLAPDPEQAARLLASKGPAWVKAWLLSQSGAQILETLARHPELRKDAPPPYADGLVVPADLAGAFDRGEFNRVPTLIGVTRDEAKLFASKVYKLGDAQRFGLMLRTDPDAPPAVPLEDLLGGSMLPWLGPGLYNAYTGAITAILGRGVNASISRVAKYEPQVYAYRFDWDRGPEPWKTLYGAAHAIDLPFVFGNFSRNFFAMDFSARNRPGREALSRLMMQSLGAFLRSGDPNVPESGLGWKPWNVPDGPRQKLVLDATDSGLRLSLD